MKVALSGSTGRMGRALRELIENTRGFQITAEAHGNCLPSSWEPKNLDGVIDFSLPPLFSETLAWCAAHKKPLVSGTTGLTAKQKKTLQQSARKIPICYATNMSWGIWLVKNWVKTLSPPSSFQILLEDIHHKNKKDQPSGTALSLKASFPPSLKKKVEVTSERRGREFGTHRIILRGEEEEILLQHKAFNRQVFAKGALRALKWLNGRPPKLYSMDDIYGSR